MVVLVHIYVKMIISGKPLLVIIILPFASCIHRQTFNVIMMTGLMVMFLVMLPVMLPVMMVNLCIIDHHGHVVFFVSVKELSDVCPCEVLLLRLYQHLSR